jgi:general secretion pathway protein G
MRCNERISRRRAFTLVEIMIVVVILGVLAAMVVPQFLSASALSRENAMGMDLQRIRTQLQIYKVQHGDTWPALSTFTEQLTQASNPRGDTATPGTAGYGLGPYIREVPANPKVGTRDVGVGGVGTSAWFYDETTGDFRANDSIESRAF